MEGRDSKGRFTKGNDAGKNSPRNKLAAKTYQALNKALDKTNHDWVESLVGMATGSHPDLDKLEYVKDKLTLQQKAMDMLVKMVLKNTPTMIELDDVAAEDKPATLTPEQRKKVIAQLEAA